MGRAKGKRPLGVIKDKKSRANTFRNRSAGLKKKISELSTLCDANACLLCFGEDGNLQAWPEQQEFVDPVVKRYCNFDIAKREKSEENITSVLDREKEKFEKQIQKKLSFPTWDDGLDSLSDEGLKDLVGILDSRLEKIRERTDLLKTKSHQPLPFSGLMGNIAGEGSSSDDQLSTSLSEFDDSVVRQDNVEESFLPMFSDPTLNELLPFEYWKAMLQACS